MLIAPAGVKIHLALGRTDMRKGFDSLAVLVQEVLKKDPFSGHLFAFRGKKADTMCVRRQVDFGTLRIIDRWPDFAVPSSGSLASPLPLGSVRTEIASVELDALALLFVHKRRADAAAPPRCRPQRTERTFSTHSHRART
jgi:hypothetical protein